MDLGTSKGDCHDLSARSCHLVFLSCKDNRKDERLSACTGTELFPHPRVRTLFLAHLGEGPTPSRWGQGCFVRRALFWASLTVEGAPAPSLRCSGGSAAGVSPRLGELPVQLECMWVDGR